jgi:hypothetical protein
VNNKLINVLQSAIGDELMSKNPDRKEKGKHTQRRRDALDYVPSKLDIFDMAKFSKFFADLYKKKSIKFHRDGKFTRINEDAANILDTEISDGEVIEAVKRIKSESRLLLAKTIITPSNQWLQLCRQIRVNVSNSQY